jgi:PAS domain S-box-containing protein
MKTKSIYLHQNRNNGNMFRFEVKISDAALDQERLKGARLSANLRWVLIAIIISLLALQAIMGHRDVSKHALVFVTAYTLFNIFLWISARRGYDPRFLRFLAATLDTVFITYHIFGMAVVHDPIAATAASTILFLPLFFLLHTFRLDRALLVYLIIISLIGFNFTYFLQYSRTPEIFNQSLSLSPIAHIFKSVYIAFIGLLCIYLQYSMLVFLQKQLDEARDKAELDIAFSIEQEKSLMSKQLFEKERHLNKELEEEIRKKDEYANQLKEAQALVGTIMSNLVGAVSRCLYDERWTAKFYSEKIEDITGYPAVDFIDNKEVSFSDIMLDEDMERVRKSIDESVSTKKPYSIEFRIRHKDGRIVWVHENGQPVFDPRGNIMYLDGITTDITEKKNAEQSFKELTDFLPQTVFETDKEGYLLFQNKAGLEFFGEGQPDESGRIHTSQFFDQAFRDKVKENLQNPIRLDSDKIFSAEANAIKRDGSICPVMIYSTAMARDGKLVGERGIIVDISNLKNTERELKQAKQELEKLNQDLEKKIEERTLELTEANTQLINLQKENLQSQFEVLKQQVNPHFLFNSLNVLTSLIKVDPDLAETFTERLSKVYRYVLENKDKDVIPIETEMEFLRAYIFLLGIRFSNKVIVDIEFDEKQMDAYVVPLALQLLIENAIKHNTFSRKSPLRVKMFIDDEKCLNVVNNLQSRETRMNSTGIGLVNITKRYALLSEKQPEFEITENEFIARIPLISKNI